MRGHFHITEKEKGEKLYNRIGKLTTILFIATIVAAMFAAVSIVKADPTTTLYIVPSSIDDPSITPGSTIVINASVTDATNIFTWQVKVFFNPTVLNATQATYPSDHIFTGLPFIPVTPVLDNTAGSVTIGASLIGSASGFTGSGTLCQMEFTVLSRGLSPLDFSEPYGSDTFLLDPDLSEIPAEVNNGYFDNRLDLPEPPVAIFDYSPKPVIVSQMITFDASASYDPDGTIVNYEWNFGDSGAATGQIATHTYTSPGNYQANLTVTDNDAMTNSTIKEIVVYESRPAKLYVNPAEIVDPTLLPPTVVTINVTVDYVTNMYDYEFRLSYNTEMLTCIGAIINRVQNQTSFTPLILIDDGAGYIWVNVTYYPPAIPITTVTPLDLVTIFFQIDSTGSSILHLSDTELSDPNRQPMSHETEDGFIMTLIRDVTIIHVAPSTNWVYQGWPVDISITAKNLGNVSETFDVEIYYDGNLAGTLPVVGLPPDIEANLVFTWDTTGVPEGNYTISAEATAVPFEYNTANNIFTDGNVRVFTQIRDVAIIDLFTSREWVFPGIPVNVSVTAKNLGEISETFDIQIYYDSNVLTTYSIVDLPPSTEITKVFTWDTSSLAPCNNYTITAEATIVPYEYNATNNAYVDGTVKIRYIGDINGDGVTDMRDIALAAHAFGSYPDTPRWNPDADITGPEYLVPDGTVDMRDVALIARHFGSGC
jgi:PKD repeat protein